MDHSGNKHGIMMKSMDAKKQWKATATGLIRWCNRDRVNKMVGSTCCASSNGGAKMPLKSSLDYKSNAGERGMKNEDDCVR